MHFAAVSFGSFLFFTSPIALSTSSSQPTFRPLLAHSDLPRALYHSTFRVTLTYSYQAASLGLQSLRALPGTVIASGARGVAVFDAQTLEELSVNPSPRTSLLREMYPTERACSGPRLERCAAAVPRNRALVRYASFHAPLLSLSFGSCAQHCAVLAKVHIVMRLIVLLDYFFFFSSARSSRLTCCRSCAARTRRSE